MTDTAGAGELEPACEDAPATDDAITAASNNDPSPNAEAGTSAGECNKPVMHAQNKRKKSRADSSDVSLEKANNLMSVVYKQLTEPKQQPNATRAFCDMLYRQLMTIEDEHDRETLQFQLHSTVMQHKMRSRQNVALSNIENSGYYQAQYPGWANISQSTDPTASTPTTTFSEEVSAALGTYWNL